MKRTWATSAAVLLAALTLSPAGSAEDTPTTGSMTEREQRNTETVRKLLQGFADGNADQIDQLVHEDFANHHAPEGLRDRAGFHQIVAQAHGAFSTFDTFELQPRHLFAKGDMVAMMDVGEGTKNGKEYRHADIHIFVMKDGRMYEHWNSFGLPSQAEALTKFMEAAQ